MNMADFKIWFTVTIIATVSVVYSLPTPRDPKSLKNEDLSVYDNSGLNLVRRKRHTIKLIGRNRCAKGMIWYIMECKTYQEYKDMEYDDIAPITEAVQTDKSESDDTFETNVPLTVLPQIKHDPAIPQGITAYMQPETIKNQSKSPMLETKPAGTELNPLVTDITFLMSDSTPIVTELSPIVTDLPRVVSELSPVVTEITPVVTELPRVVAELSPVVTEITPVVTESTPVETDSTAVAKESTAVVTESTVVVTEPTPAVTKITLVDIESTPVPTDQTIVIYTLFLLGSFVAVFFGLYKLLCDVICKRTHQDYKDIRLQDDIGTSNTPLMTGLPPEPRVSSFYL